MNQLDAAQPETATGNENDNSNYALERIRALLDPGKLDADRKLPTERALCDMLGVSRRAVRRALEVLVAEGHIWRRQGSGTFVGPAPTHPLLALDNLNVESNYIEVMEVRLRIEPQLTQLAALRATPADIDRLRALLSRISNSKDADERELWDSSFHRMVAETAGNALFLTIFDVIDKVRQESTWVHIRERARSNNSLSLYRAQHRTIVDAIAAHDPQKAGEAMRQHLLALQENLIRQTSMGISDVS